MNHSRIVLAALLVAACGRDAAPRSESTPRPSEPPQRAEAPAEWIPPAAPPREAAPAVPAEGAAAPAAAALAELPPGLLTPASATEQAPARFTIKFDTTKGNILVDVQRAWSPKGADRIYNLVKLGYFNDVAFFRVVAGFMAQVGIHGDPRVNDAWRDANITDDPVTQSNTRGMVSFATGGPNTRTTQFFINFGDNSRLDGMGFSPFGKVRDMATVDALHAGYGEGAPMGQGPNQALIQRVGNPYLREEFPRLDYIRSATIE